MTWSKQCWSKKNDAFIFLLQHLSDCLDEINEISFTLTRLFSRRVTSIFLFLCYCFFQLGHHLFVLGVQDRNMIVFLASRALSLQLDLVNHFLEWRIVRIIEQKIFLRHFHGECLVALSASNAFGHAVAILALLLLAGGQHNFVTLVAGWTTRLHLVLWAVGIGQAQLGVSHLILPRNVNFEGLLTFSATDAHGRSDDALDLRFDLLLGEWWLDFRHDDD